MNRPLYSPKTIQDLLERHGFTFSKALGQNFLIDGNIIEKIIEAGEVLPAPGHGQAQGGSFKKVISI